MRLENLYENFASLPAESQQAYIAAYRLRRAIDMDKPAFKKKRKASSSPAKKTELSEQEKLLMQVLGLKKSEVIALRTITEDTEIEANPDDEKLLQDSTFEEEEDE